MVDHQREKRYPCNTPLKFAVTETGLLFSGKAGNVSLHGLCFDSVRSAQPGQSVHIRTECPLPNQERCHVRGEVRWCQCRQQVTDAVYRIGVRLENGRFKADATDDSRP